MKIVLQRVKEASVEVENNIIGKINAGFLVLVGITETDNEKTVEYLADKMCNLRVFNDEQGKMNISIKDTNGELLIVSQFTLYADCSSGNRPSFTKAARPEKAEILYEYFKEKCKEKNINVQSGKFGADMKIKLVNDGPVTIILEK